MGKADIHIHSACGDGMATTAQLLDYVERETDLSVIAVTDHDDLKGGLQAREEWARGRYRFEVIAGEEVTSLQGHLIALFIEEKVPSLKPLQETLEAVHRQGGLCIIPHPLNWLTRSIGQRSIEKVMRQRGSGIYFDAMQAGNCSPGSRVTRRRPSASTANDTICRRSAAATPTSWRRSEAPTRCSRARAPRTCDAPS